MVGNTADNHARQHASAMYLELPRMRREDHRAAKASEAGVQVAKDRRAELKGLLEKPGKRYTEPLYKPGTSTRNGHPREKQNMQRSFVPPRETWSRNGR